MEREKDPIKVAGSYLNSFAQGDPDLIASHVADEFENIHTSALGEPCTGRSTYRGLLVNFLKKFEGISYEMQDAVSQGEKVFASYIMTAKVDSNPIEINGVFNFLISDGLIKRRIDYFDSLTFLKQIGHPVGMEDN